MNELSLFNSLFDDGLDFAFPEFYRVKNTAVPKVDVQEHKDAYLLTMELPGRTDADVDINVKDSVLTIASVKKAEKEEKQSGANDEKWLVRERRMTQFSRSFTLPDDVDTQGISATFKNGLLDITLPRNAQKNEVKKIAITAA